MHTMTIYYRKHSAKSLLYANKVNFLWEHDLKKIIGMAKAKEDRYGLYIEGTIFLNLPHAKNVYELIDLMKINHMSIGYRVNNYYRKMGLRYIKEVELCEISF